MNILLNESYLGLSEESRIAMKIKGIESINKMFSESDNLTETKGNVRNG